VVEPAPANTRERSVEIREALGSIGYPVDVIVMRTERFERTKRVIGGMRTRQISTGVLSMPAFDPEVESLVRQWLEKAEADLEVARRMSAEAADNLRIREIVGFH
jgi:hypothetical protein